MVYIRLICKADIGCILGSHKNIELFCLLNSRNRIEAYFNSVFLPEGVVNVDNLVSANVSVKLTGIETGEVKTDNISINYDGNLYSVELITKNINVRFKGDKNEIRTVTRDDISLHVNFSDEYFETGEFSEGFHKIDATVVISENKDVVPIDDYYVILKITSANSDEP